MTPTATLAPYIADYKGRKLELRNPDPDLITIDAIQIGLQNIARFGGQSKERYSVEQHSINVYRIMSALLQRTPANLPWLRQALLHDATEAYLGDITRPLKHILPDYMEIEAIWQEMMAKKFDYPVFLHHELKLADNTALLLEAQYLGRNFPHGDLPHLTEWMAFPDFSLKRWGIHQLTERFTDIYNQIK